VAHEILDPRARELIDAEAPVEQLATGFTFTEGPVWHPLEHHLLFSDMPADVRRRWTPGVGIEEVMRPSNKANGLTYDARLDLLACEHATSSVVRFTKDGRREVLASHFEGKELNSPNDLCVRSDGSIYFSDPWYGRMPVYGVERPRELGFQGVYRIPPQGGPPQLLVERYLFDQPNGLCFSPDEKLLYVNDTVQALIRAFEVKSDGSLGAGWILASGIRSELEPGVPDGMKCDELGHPDRREVPSLAVEDPHPARARAPDVAALVANLAWGGEDWRTLFLTASRSLYAVRTKVGPRVEPYMRAAMQTSAGASVVRSSASRPPAAAAREPARALHPVEGFRLDPARCALLIQDMQNDVVMEGGAFAASGSPRHCKEQNAIANIARLAAHCRRVGVPVIHIWFVVEPGAPGVTLNCPLFEGLVESKGLVRGSWGAAPVEGLEPQPGDLVVEKMRMSAWEGTKLEIVLKALGRDILIDTGAWTNMSIEHTARTGADKGYVMIVPEDACSTMNADWHRASIDYAMRNVAAVTTTDAVIRALGG